MSCPTPAPSLSLSSLLQKRFVRVLVNGVDTGIRCSTAEDCGGPLGMLHENGGDLCVEALDLSSWVRPRLTRTQEWGGGSFSVSEPSATRQILSVLK